MPHRVALVASVGSIRTCSRQRHPLLLLVQKGENRRCRPRTVTVSNPLRSLPVPNHEASSHRGRMHLRSPFALGSHCHLWHVVYHAPRSLGDRCPRHPYPLGIYGAVRRGVSGVRLWLTVGLQKDGNPARVAQSSPRPPSSPKKGVWINCSPLTGGIYRKPLPRKRSLQVRFRDYVE
jgi:hypothetical protein